MLKLGTALGMYSMMMPHYRLTIIGGVADNKNGIMRNEPMSEGYFLSVSCLQIVSAEFYQGTL